jgi:hypothetical protein
MRPAGTSAQAWGRLIRVRACLWPCGKQRLPPVPILGGGLDRAQGYAPCSCSRYSVPLFHTASTVARILRAMVFSAIAESNPLSSIWA